MLRIFFVIFCLFSIYTNSRGLNSWIEKNLVLEKEDLFLKPYFFTQTLDHFNSYNKETFNQKYFLNDIFWGKSAKDPIFVYISGEGTLTSKAASSGFIYKAAQKHKALILALEHRFYGESLNQDGLKLKKLKFLSSIQALADLSVFVSSMKAKLKLTSETKVISFGGSYAGALSAWFRVKYPHIVYGAISSSSPVQAIVDFDGYNKVVNSSFRSQLVGGSDECLSKIRSSFKMIDYLISKKKLKQLSEDFHACQPLTNLVFDQFLFTSNIIDLFEGTVQYNNQNRSFSSVEQICSKFQDSDKPYQVLQDLYREYLDSLHQTCSDNSWSNIIKILKNITVTKGTPTDNMRQWIYQTCTQFGYYQTCNPESCPFSKRITLSPSLELCWSVYKVNPLSIYRSVNWTNVYYGSNQPAGSRILFVNGELDPWSPLSVLKNLQDEEEAIFIPGSSHCFDMRDDKPSDSSYLIEARKKIMNKLDKWLA